MPSPYSTCNRYQKAKKGEGGCTHGVNLRRRQSSVVCTVRCLQRASTHGHIYHESLISPHNLSHAAKRRRGAATAIHGSDSSMDVLRMGNKQQAAEQTNVDKVIVDQVKAMSTCRAYRFGTVQQVATNTIPGTSIECPNTGAGRRKRTTTGGRPGYIVAKRKMLSSKYPIKHRHYPSTVQYESCVRTSTQYPIDWCVRHVSRKWVKLV